MDNHNDFDNEYEYEYDWDNRYYGTGPTEPPKERGGAMALMLILITIPVTIPALMLVPPAEALATTSVPSLASEPTLD